MINESRINAPRRFTLLFQATDTTERAPSKQNECSPSRADEVGQAFDRLVIPNGQRHYLWFDPDDGRPLLASHRPHGHGAVLLEPLIDRPGSPPQLLVAATGGGEFEINGERLPVALAGIRDEIRLNGGPVLHVSLHETPYIGQAGSDLAGRPCTVCQSPVEADQWVFQCPSCRAVMHTGQTGTGGIDMHFACLAQGAEVCPDCGGAIRSEAGLMWQPEG